MHAAPRLWGSRAGRERRPPCRTPSSTRSSRGVWVWGGVRGAGVSGGAYLFHLKLSGACALSFKEGGSSGSWVSYFYLGRMGGGEGCLREDAS